MTGIFVSYDTRDSQLAFRLRDHAEALARCNYPAQTLIGLWGGGWRGGS